MAESKHTPGPWEAEGAGKSSWIKGSDGNWAALACGTDDENANANGFLISAAPELLAALKMFRNACDDAMLVEDDHVHVNFRESLLTALQVISKAEGK